MNVCWLRQKKKWESNRIKRINICLNISMFNHEELTETNKISFVFIFAHLSGAS